MRKYVFYTLIIRSLRIIQDQIWRLGNSIWSYHLLIFSLRFNLSYRLLHSTIIRQNNPKFYSSLKLFYAALCVTETHVEFLNHFLIKVVRRLTYKYTLSEKYKYIFIKIENILQPNKSKHSCQGNMFIFLFSTNYYKFKILNSKEVPKRSLCKSFCIYGT